MIVKYLYKLRPESDDLYVEAKVCDDAVNDTLVLGEFNRYNYYLVGCLDWWFQENEDLTNTLRDLEQLESGSTGNVEVCQDDALIEITLDGAQASNLSDDSVTDQPEGRFTYQEVKTIFLKYKEFLEMPVSLDSTLEFEL